MREELPLLADTDVYDYSKKQASLFIREVDFADEEAGAINIDCA